MAKILFINPPIRIWSKPNNPPLGLLYMASYLETHGHEVDICDLNALRVQAPDIISWIDCHLVKRYDYVGLSGLISTASKQKEILDHVAQRKSLRKDDFKIVLGGGLATAAHDFAIKNYGEYLDYIIVDEGETPMLQLANGDNPDSISNLIYKDERVWKKHRNRTLIDDLDDLPYPNYDKVPVDTYLANPIWGRATGNSSSINFDMKRSLNMIVSRGCPHSCNFCLKQFKTDKCSYRIRSVGNVINEIQELYDRYNIDFIGMVGDNTTINRRWVMEFCEQMMSTGLRNKVHWGGSARVDRLDLEMLQTMRLAGCEFLGIGLESISPYILKMMNKTKDPEGYVDKAKDVIAWVKESNITCNCTFMVGYFNETWNTLRATAQFMLDNDVLNNMFFSTAYPSTDLFEKVKHKIIDKYETIDNYIFDLADATEFRINCTEEFSDEELIYARKCAIGGRPDLINRKSFGELDGQFDDINFDPLLNKELMNATMKVSK